MEELNLFLLRMNKELLLFHHVVLLSFHVYHSLSIIHFILASYWQVSYVIVLCQTTVVYGLTSYTIQLILKYLFLWDLFLLANSGIDYISPPQLYLSTFSFSIWISFIGTKDTLGSFSVYLFCILYLNNIDQIKTQQWY